MVISTDTRGARAPTITATCTLDGVRHRERGVPGDLGFFAHLRTARALAERLGLDATFNDTCGPTRGRGGWRFQTGPRDWLREAREYGFQADGYRNAAVNAARPYVDLQIAQRYYERAAAAYRNAGQPEAAAACDEAAAQVAQDANRAPVSQAVPLV